MTITSLPLLIITVSDSIAEAEYRKACQLAETLSLPLPVIMSEETASLKNALYALQVTRQGYQLKYLKDDSHPLHLDFAASSAQPRFLSSAKWREALIRACGIKPQPSLTIIDATAGLGRDATLLACCGARVTLIERAPILAVLLAEALERLPPEHFLTSRLTLIQGNALEYLKNLTEQKAPDVIYLDPMYPERHKSALVKKELRFIRDWVGSDEDASALFAIARERAPRVVVKRPAKGAAITLLKPTFILKHERVRFDVYVRDVRGGS